MSSKNDKYRNPPTPLGYIKKTPRLVMKESINSEDIDIDKIIKLIIDSGICEEPDISAYEHFTINSSSDEEEIVEVPVVIPPKVIEVLDLEDDAKLESKEDIHTTIKKEVIAPKHKAITETSEDRNQDTKGSLFPDQKKISFKTDTGCHKSEHFSPKLVKEHDQSSKRSSRSKKIQERKDTCDSYDSDCYIKRSKHKKLDYDSDDSHNRFRYRKKESYDSDSHSRRRLNDRIDSDNSSSCEKRVYKRLDSENDSDSDSYCYKTKSRREYNADKSDYLRKVKRRRSPSPNSKEKNPYKEYNETDKNIKQEPQSCLLYGEYQCEICNVSMNNFTTYESHINGRRHKKALMKNAPNDVGQDVSQSAAKTPLLQMDSKYPKSPPGYYRITLDSTARIQSDLDKNTKTPYPGLDKITEIQGVAEISYYCSFCDCICSYNCILQHLNGFKHQLNCLKYYRNDLYQKWNYKQKYQIADAVIERLKAEERRSGKGMVKVEKDVKETENPDVESEKTAWNDPDRPSTSAQGQDMDYLDNYLYNSKPDPTKSGYYCKLCDSHSNSEAMWQSHIIGKRHLANLKKLPGTAPSKSKYIPAASNVHPHLFDILKRDNVYHAPVVGLCQIREIRKPDINGVSFNCFLCGACISSLEIVGHILSPKHREKYLASIKHPELETLRNCQISESYRNSIIEEICSSVEAEEGPGKPEVYYAKNAVLRG